ncbi:MAG TPA: hypothetical protein VE398_24480, partial [Acidobacteriota bacterium]|nr:hypothetical protein [Acidobacteriota bacterium]
MKSVEAQQPLFRELAAGLPDEAQAEFFRNLHEAGIGPNDVELARLLRALQLYKSYYESIPAAVKDAAGEIQHLKQEIESIVSNARESSDAAADISAQVLQETDRFREDLAAIHKRVEEAVSKSAESLAARMAELLGAAIEENVLSPLQARLAELADSNRGFKDAIARNNQASAALHRNAVVARRIHLGAYSLGGILIVCALALGAWLYLERWYTNRLDRDREVLIAQTDQNRAVLQQLARSRRTLELVQDPEHPHRKLLIMKDASGWRS